MGLGGSCVDIVGGFRVSWGAVCQVQVGCCGLFECSCCWWKVRSGGVLFGFGEGLGWVAMWDSGLGWFAGFGG